MWVRLKNLKSKPELNGKECRSDDATTNGRYMVKLKDGGSIAVKPENIDILERGPRKLDGCVGLVDACDPNRLRYKVLIVNSNERTEERCHVRLKGLTKRPELNGQEAKIESF